MLDLRDVTENLDEVRTRLATRGDGGLESLDRLAALDERRRASIAEVEKLRAERNDASKAMASLDKASEEFAAKRTALKELGGRIKELEAALDEVKGELDAIVLSLPNLPHGSVPEGESEADNPVVRTWGEAPSFDFAPKAHDELGVALGILDFERAAKISGARFAVLRGAGARLERGLIGFMLDLHTGAHGYEELWPPALVRDAALMGTGQLPKFEADVFRAVRHYEEGDEAERLHHYLSPTAEVQITNYHREEIFEPEALPVAYCAYTPCFRSEAGSYGKDTRGLIRQHQFDKVELVHFCRPEEALDRHEALVGHAEKVLQELGLHYRVVELCTADLGFAAKKCFDLEVWLPGQDAYREISSCSWFGDFQARRAKIRHRPEAGAKPQLVHTLNGSGLAVGRTLVAILEQYQREDGTVVVPEKLRPHLGGLEVLEPK
ncbi:MAG TPA: serine--tRNA ligase [Sandaracinaceae bacterium LLY-WYZ-13_1]|nr:serine--tRNA ligase [Sandaracinaceae bacterium LLY-WYZ-13_1]